MGKDFIRQYSIKFEAKDGFDVKEAVEIKLPDGYDLEKAKVRLVRHINDFHAKEAAHRAGLNTQHYELTFELTEELKAIPVDWLVLSDPELDPKAPTFGWMLLALTCSRDELDAITGDIEESFGRYIDERGKAAAYWWFWVQIVKSFAHLAIRAIQKAIPLADLFKKLIG